jgi:hypothetical protein
MPPGEPEFTVRPAGVVHDTIDGETLVIDLETGSYYTLEGAGATAWQVLTGGATQAAVTSAVAGTLKLGHEAAADAVARLLLELHDKELIWSPDGGRSDIRGASTQTGTVLPGLALRCYDELQELLLIDPIHEVDDAGWPNRDPAST